MNPTIVAVIEAGIDAIAAIVDTIRSAKSGAVDPDAALAQIKSFTDALAKNNAAADSALDAKFPNG